MYRVYLHTTLARVPWPRWCARDRVNELVRPGYMERVPLFSSFYVASSVILLLGRLSALFLLL